MCVCVRARLCMCVCVCIAYYSHWMVFTLEEHITLVHQALGLKLLVYEAISY
jgi:hypothetical protein